MVNQPTPIPLPDWLILITDDHYAINGGDQTLDSHIVDIKALANARIDLLNGAHLTVNSAGVGLGALGHITYGIGNNCTLSLSAPSLGVDVAHPTTIDFGLSEGTGMFEYQPGNLDIKLASPIKIINLHEGDKIKVEGATSADLAHGTLHFKTGEAIEPPEPHKTGLLPGVVKVAKNLTKSVTDKVKDVLGTGARFTIDPAATFKFASVGNDGQITITTPCFVAGTLISTPAGEIPVENLKKGDPVYTMKGGVAPIRWIGRRRIDPRTVSPLREHVPVRIRPGALDPGSPNRDLYVSPDHCLFHSGSLIPAKLLINGRSITQEPTLEPFTYYHIELESHDVLIAEGAYVESYLDLGNRAMFLEPGTLMFCSPAGPKQVAACYPPIYSGPILDTVRKTLEHRAIELGYRGGERTVPGKNTGNVFPFSQQKQ
ncbi:Hint domain-containing protein [Phyllobacterium myrsinacearum]|nr:Hint domain-containing protein [Phyllobacterium myrsinacearum]